MTLPFAHLDLPTTEQLIAAADAVANAIASAADRPDEPWSPGKWTRRQLATHIADTESVMLDRVRRVLAENTPQLADLPENLWAANLPAKRDLVVAAGLFRACRLALADLLRALPGPAMDRIGIHSAYGRMRLADILRHCHGHAEHHARQLNGVPTVAPSYSEAPVKILATHTATVTWANNDPQAGSRYSRVHQWSFDGGIVLRASASPHVVPLPLSAEDAVDPEEAVVAATSSCHLLTMLWLAKKAGFLALSYTDQAFGELAADADGGRSLRRIVLRPTIVWQGRAPTTQELADLHHRTHGECYIARSLRCPVEVEAAVG